MPLSDGQGWAAVVGLSAALLLLLYAEREMREKNLAQAAYLERNLGNPLIATNLQRAKESEALPSQLSKTKDVDSQTTPQNTHTSPEHSTTNVNLVNDFAAFSDPSVILKVQETETQPNCQISSSTILPLTREFYIKVKSKTHID